MTSPRIVGALLLVASLAAAAPVAAQPAAAPALVEATQWYTGVAGRVDDERARMLLEQAAATGDPLARMWVARCLSRGRMGLPRDEAQARALAATVIADVHQAADAGILEAVFLMGTAYDEGLGLVEDPAAAVSWFRRAAARGHVLAQHNLGNAYAAGRGLPQDDRLAVEWWLKAAAAGDAIPQLRLGDAYEQGRGVARDLAVARRWYRDAAGRGNAAAAAALARLGG